RRSGSRRGRRCAGCDRNSGYLRTEFEVASGEFIEPALVFEEDDFAEGLRAELETNGDLRHRRVSDVPGFRVHAPTTVRAADDDPAFTDRRKHRVTVTLVEEMAALSRRLEDLDRLGVFVFFLGFVLRCAR